MCLSASTSACNARSKSRSQSSQSSTVPILCFPHLTSSQPEVKNEFASTSIDSNWDKHLNALEITALSSVPSFVVVSSLATASAFRQVMVIFWTYEASSVCSAIFVRASKLLGWRSTLMCRKKSALNDFKLQSLNPVHTKRVSNQQSSSSELRQ
jgi:hypothetical protein